MCIAQQDYCCILNQVELNTQRVEEEGEIVMVKEHRELDRTGTRKGHIVVKVNVYNVILFLFYLYEHVASMLFLVCITCSQSNVCKNRSPRAPRSGSFNI